MLNELRIRHKKTKKFMKEQGIDALLILQNIDLYYYTNTLQAIAFYLPVEGDGLVFYKRAEEGVKSDCPLESLKVNSMRDIPEVLQRKSYPLARTLGFEFDVLPMANYYRVKKLFPDAEAVDASIFISKTKMVKTDYEVDIFRKCGKTVKSLYETIKALYKEGMSEFDLSREIEYAFRKKSHLGPLRMRGFNLEGFMGHVLSGESALIPAPLDLTLGGKGIHPAFSQAASNKYIEKNESIIIDYIFNFEGYQIDTTRTFVYGDLSGFLKKQYENVLDIYFVAKRELVPGNTCKDVYEKALLRAQKLGIEEHFMGYRETRVNFIGHGIGLEVNEFPVIAPKSDIVLEKNMVIAVEPKLFFPDQGAVGIEDTLLINENGCEKLADISEDYIRI